MPLLIQGNAIPSVRLNYQMLTLIEVAAAACSDDNVISVTPALLEIADRLGTHHDRFPSRVGSTLVDLSLWANEPVEACRSLRVCP